MKNQEHSTLYGCETTNFFRLTFVNIFRCRRWNLYLGMLLGFGLPVSLAAEASNPDSSDYHKKCVAVEKLPEIQAAQSAIFASLKQSLAASRMELGKNKLPELVRERMSKRFKISDRLETIIEETLKKKDRDSILFVRRAVRDLQLFDRYYKDELEYGKKVLGMAIPRRFSVRDFGARGDGVTDDSLAFQKAFKAIR